MSRRPTFASDVSFEGGAGPHVEFPPTTSGILVPSGPVCWRNPRINARDVDAKDENNSVGLYRRSKLKDNKALKRLSSISVPKSRRATLASNVSFEGGAAALGSHAQNVAPTYKLNPVKYFDVRAVQNIIETTLHEELEDVKYEAERTAAKICTITDLIKEKTKELQLDRYKIVAVVSIGQRDPAPGVTFSSQGLWNSKTDGFASASLMTDQLYAVASVYGVYLD